jgi:hypothetical protein
LEDILKETNYIYHFRYAKGQRAKEEAAAAAATAAGDRNRALAYILTSKVILVPLANNI